jgi:hypothetical protein
MTPASLSQWNLALVTALFLRPDRARTTLSRIDATGRVLEELCESQDRASAKWSFIKAFGSDPEVIKKHFTLSPSIAILTKRDGIPPNFAALYLSLLAATADDDTFQVGKFRRRFAALLEIDELEGFHFQDLPDLWKQFASWSRSRAASIGDCAVLILPDPQHETRIGHSKRLAFPSYRDELCLRSALADFAVDSRDPFQAVSRAAYERLGKFTQTFKDELSGFRSLVHAERLQEAYDSPFWGAVRDITRESEEKELAQFGRLCVQLDTADPQFPELSVLADERAFLSFGKGQAVRLPRARGPYVASWAGASLKASVSYLMSIAEKDKAFARSRLGVALKAGCLPFFLDALGGLSSDGRYFENGPCCLLMRSDTVKRIKSLASHVGLRCTEMGTEETAGTWTLLSFSAASRLFMERLALEVTAGARKLFALGWVPAMPRIAGAARYGQAVFLSPASNPYVRLEGAVAGQYAILDGSGVELAAGSLRASDEGFYIPPFQLMGIKRHAVCHFSLQIEGSSASLVLEVPVVDGAPGAPLQAAENRHSWLIDGRLGVRESLAASFLPADRTLARSGGQIGHFGASRSLFFQASINVETCTRASVEAIHPALDWLAEALSLRFQTRGALQFNELKEHLRMAGEAADIDSWRLRRTLVAGGWLQPIESPLSPHGAVAAGSRTISWIRQGGRIIARIRGMLTKQERASLANRLAPGDCIQRIVDPSMPLSIGCIELDVSSEDRALEIASMLGLRQLPQAEAAQDVLGGLLLSRTHAAEAAAPALGSTVTLWDTGTFKWIPERVSRDLLPVGSILRSEGRQRHIYFLKVDTGYRSTDSLGWALLIKAACSVEGLGTISKSGDVDWAGSLLSLPNALSSWWMHFGGGVVGVGNSGNYAFRGGNGMCIWEGIAYAGSQLPERQESRADERRTLALYILKGKRMRRVR